MFQVTFIVFNLCESIFWFCFSILSLVGLKKYKIMPAKFWYFLAIDFLIFGISDIVEAFYPVSFFSPVGEWLFIWKTLCVIGFVLAIGWYLKVRGFNSK
ncbi:MAG: hypothetical protein WCJ59_01460 [bacterium]